MAVESVGRGLPVAFLERVRDDFNERYGGGRAATAAAKSLNKEFGCVHTVQDLILSYLNMYVVEQI